MAKFIWKSSPVVKRYEGNPVLTKDDVPYPVDQAYNAGVEYFQGRYVMLFRSEHWLHRWEKTERRIGFAESKDGIHWKVRDNKFLLPPGVHMAEDPRLFLVEGKLYATFANNSPDGLRGCIAVSEDFEEFELVYMSAPDNRNFILFPEKINGLYGRLERPFRGYQHTKPAETWFNTSPDMRNWGTPKICLRSNAVPFCNAKNGPAGQAIKTLKGWLALFHAAFEDPTTEYPSWRQENWCKLYCSGVMLLDLNDPSKIIGISREPLMVPEPPYDYETDGFRSYAIFTTATLLEKDGQTVRIYYGAADTVLAMATAKLDDLLAMCKPV